MLYLPDEIVPLLAIAESWLLSPYEFISVKSTSHADGQRRFLHDCEQIDCCVPTIRSAIQNTPELQNALVNAGPGAPLFTPDRFMKSERRVSVTYTECILDHLQELSLIGHTQRMVGYGEDRRSRPIEECVGISWREKDLHFDFSFTETLPAFVRIECAKAGVLIGEPSHTDSGEEGQSEGRQTAANLSSSEGCEIARSMTPKEIRESAMSVSRAASHSGRRFSGITEFARAVGCWHTGKTIDAEWNLVKATLLAKPFPQTVSLAVETVADREHAQTLEELLDEQRRADDDTKPTGVRGRKARRV